MKKIYIKIARKLDQTTLSFIIGLLSGWFINLLTGTLANGWFIAGVVTLLLCVICNFGLQLVNNSIRDHYDREYDQELLNRSRDKYIPKTAEQIKANSYGYNPKWQGKFLFAFFGGGLMFLLSIVFIVFGNVALQRDNNQQMEHQFRMGRQLDTISANEKTHQSQLSEISAKLDSIHAALKKSPAPINHQVRPLQ